MSCRLFAGGKFAHWGDRKMYVFALGEGNSGLIGVRRYKAMLYQQINEKLDERLSEKVNTALAMGAKTTQRVKVLT